MNVSQKSHIHVLVFGTFDFLHDGHRNFFAQAKQHGTFLTVVVARDKTAHRVKKDPLQDEQQRLSAVRSCPRVDRAVLGNIRDQYRVIERIRPSIICLGYDQTHFTKNLKAELIKRHVSCRIVRLKPFYPDIYKSSLMRIFHNRAS